MRTPRLAPSFLAFVVAPGIAAQQQERYGEAIDTLPKKVIEYGDVVNKIDGRVVDLSRDSAGRLLYCTAEGDVGRVIPGGPQTLLATAQSGPFPNPLRAVAETPSGDVAVLDSFGHVRVLYGGAAPAALVYPDQWMISDATDLIVDSRGSFLIASATPSSGVRAMNWIGGNGQNWGYYLVKHSPLQLAHDPLTGGIVIADGASGGNLQLVIAGSAVHATTGLDTSTHPGITAAQSDGDVASEADGDLYWIAGGNVYKRSRASGTTTLFDGGFGQLRGAAITASTNHFNSVWSLYVAEGESPTRLREIPKVDAPGAVIANDQGPAPGKGTRLNLTLGFQAYELTADNDGRLLLGGTNWGSPNLIKRVTLTGTPSISTLATTASGLVDVVEGLCVAPDDAIYSLARNGTIQRITEGPLTITTVFADPGAQITNGKDLALDMDGTLYVAASESWGFGKLLKITNPSGATLLSATEETRGLAANPAGGLFVSQWRNMGFHGTVDLFHFTGNWFEAQPGFSGINYYNGQTGADGDLCVDVNGSVYSLSEDDWSLVRYDPAQDGFVRIGGGYQNHPSGLAIAPSTAGSGSTTGWSLYVGEFDNLWERPSVQAPASCMVDSSLGLTAARSVAGVPDPSLGRPRAIVPAPFAGGILIATAQGRVLGLDPASGNVVPIAGEAEGLRGDLVALFSAPNDRRVLVLNRAGELFELRVRQVRRLAVEPELLAPVVERVLAHPQNTARIPSCGGDVDWFALDGWVVWHVAAE